MFAVDDGIWTGKFTLADIFFLIAVIVFALAAFAHWPRNDANALPYSGFLVALGLTFTALGLLVL